MSLALLRRWAMPAAVGTSAADEPPRCSFLLALTLALLVTLVAGLTLATTTANAEEVFTSQAAATNATDSTWIPAPEKRAALCLVDTGVDQNPDTTNVIARLSVDGGDPGDLSPDHHGTLMAMIAAAPYNGWGMVGAAPSINIVSVRASRDGQTFGGTDVATAVQVCRNYRVTYNIKAISLSLGGPLVADLDAASMATVENMVSSAHKAGLSVAAAAGNHKGPVDWPAGYAPALAVGAAGDLGAQCGFAASGPEVDLWAPGCPLDAVFMDGTPAWSSGSSGATAFVAAIVVQLRQLSPSLSVDDAEAMLADLPPAAGARLLDVDRAFRRAGLADALAGGHTVMPSTTIAPEQLDSPAAPSPDAGAVPALSARPQPGIVLKPLVPATRPAPRLPRPGIRNVRVRRGVLGLTLTNRAPSWVANVVITTRSARKAFPRPGKTQRLRADRLRTRVSGMLKEVTISYHDPTGVRPDSPTLRAHPKAR